MHSVAPILLESGMLFAEVDSSPACALQPRSLRQLALRSFVENTDWDSINSLYVNNEFPSTLYRDMWEEQKYLANPHEYHDWSKPGHVPVEVFLKIMNYDLDDGVPNFAFEWNSVSKNFVEIHFHAPGIANIPITRRICIPCYNTFARYNSCNFYGFEKFVLVRDMIILEGDALIDFMQCSNVWCSRCYNTSLFSISNGERFGHQWLDSVYLFCDEIRLLPVADA